VHQQVPWASDNTAAVSRKYNLIFCLTHLLRGSVKTLRKEIFTPLDGWGGNTGWPTFAEYEEIRSVSARPEIERSFADRLAQAATGFGGHSKEWKDEVWLVDYERNPWDVNLASVQKFFCTNLGKVTSLYAVSLICKLTIIPACFGLFMLKINWNS